MIKRLTMMIIGCILLMFSLEVKAANVRGEELVVNDDNLKEYEIKYDIPKEVVSYVKETLNSNPEAEILISIPETMTARGRAGSWGPVRTYKGFKLKDWNVEVRNAFKMTSVINGKSSSKFSKTILLYGGGVLLDKIIPFGSAGLTIVDFISENGKVIYATSGDKVQVAPKYVSKTKFTYVKEGANFVLGARTHMATLQQITWYFYSGADHKQYIGIKSYNKTGKTPSYNNPDPKAITGSGTGGYLESDVYVSINGKRFVLN